MQLLNFLFGIFALHGESALLLGVVGVVGVEALVFVHLGVVESEFVGDGLELLKDALVHREFLPPEAEGFEALLELFGLGLLALQSGGALFQALLGLGQLLLRLVEALGDGFDFAVDGMALFDVGLLDAQLGFGFSFALSGNEELLVSLGQLDLLLLHLVGEDLLLALEPSNAGAVFVDLLKEGAKFLHGVEAFEFFLFTALCEVVFVDVGKGFVGGVKPLSQDLVLMVPVEEGVDVLLLRAAVGNGAGEVGDALLVLLHLGLAKAPSGCLFAACIEFGHGLSGFSSEGENLLGDVAVDVCSGELFEELALVFAVGEEESGEAVLREEDGADKLVVVEPHDALHFLVDLPDTIGEEGLFALRQELVEGACGAGESAVAREAHAPMGFVALAGGHDKTHTSVALLCTASQEGARVGGIELLRLFVGTGGEVGAHAFEARSFAVEGKADGIEEGAFAGSCVAGDGKKSCRAERFGGEVYEVFASDGGEVAEGDGFDGHAAKRL